VYDYNPINDRHLNVTIPVNENLIVKNRTLYLHMQFKARNPFFIKGVNDKDYDDMGVKGTGSDLAKPEKQMAKIKARV
jgi:hypothetical protein